MNKYIQEAADLQQKYIDALNNGLLQDMMNDDLQRDIDYFKCRYKGNTARISRETHIPRSVLNSFIDGETLLLPYWQDIFTQWIYENDIHVDSERHIFYLTRRLFTVDDLLEYEYGNELTAEIQQDNGFFGLGIDFFEGEEWKEYPLNKNYLVSSYGRVFSLNKYMIIAPMKKSPKNIQYNSKYIRFVLYKNNIRTTITAQKLVARTFHGLPDEPKQAHHIDGNVWNNKKDNILWVTMQQHKLIHRLYEKYKAVTFEDKLKISLDVVNA